MLYHFKEDILEKKFYDNLITKKCDYLYKIISNNIYDIEIGKDYKTMHKFIIDYTLENEKNIQKFLYYFIKTYSNIIKKSVDIIISKIKYFLVGKNTSYGSSIFKNKNYFSDIIDNSQKVLIRVDDKINRIIYGSSFSGDNDYLDIIGYLIIYLILEDLDENK